MSGKGNIYSSESMLSPQAVQSVSPVQSTRDKAPRGSNLSQSVAVKSALDKRMAEENFKRQAAELR